MRNRRAAAFFRRKSYLVAMALVLAAAFGMTGLYYSQQGKEQEAKLAAEKKEQVQQAKAEDKAMEKAAQEKAVAAAQEKAREKAAEAEREAEAKKAREEAGQEEADAQEAQAGQDDDFMDEPEVVAQASAPIEPELAFDAEKDLNWPLQGNVILNYSMDQSVYFASLKEYKYNPAIVIQGEVNAPVRSAADGKVTDISTSEETGTCVTVDLGSGYSARYGQLKEIPKKVGDYVGSGETIGYVSEPTKYFSEEGANLYFQLLKDGTPVDPMEYLE